MPKMHFKAFVYFALVVLVLCGVPSSSMSQGVEVWSNLGLYGGQIYDIAIDPSNPDKMFAGSYMGDGLFVTEDGGSSWQAVETENELEGEDAFDDHAVWAVRIAPSNNNVVWVAHNFWVEKSTDGGQTWTHIWNSSMQRDCPNCGGEGDNFRFCRSVTIDPSDPETVYVGTGGPYGSSSSGAIYKTVDGGLTWQKTGFDASNEFDYTVVDIDIDPQNSNIIWAVTSSFGYGGWAGTLYRSVDGGAIWEVALDLGYFGGAYLTVAAKPGDPNTAFTGSSYGIIKHWFDVQWNFSQPCPQSALVEDISFDPQDSNIVYAVWLYPISWGGDGIGKVARSFDGGDTWLEEDIYPHDYDFLTVAVHPANSEILLAGDRNLGVYKSEDHGQTWTPINNGINAVIVYDVAIDPNDSTHLLAGTISGVYEKKGGGDWSRLISYSTKSLRFHPTDSLTFYAGLWGWLAKTTDGGLSWGFASLTVDSWVEDMAIDPTDTDILFIAVGQWILKSTDGGANFEGILLGQNQSNENYDFNVVLIDPSDHQYIFAGGGNFYAPKVLGDLWESKDGGANWTRTGLQDLVVNDLLIDPNNSEIMYAGCGYSGGTDVPIYKSTDGGDTWTASYDGIPGFRIILEGVWGSSASDVFAVGKYGAFFTDTPIFHYNGSSWAKMASDTTEDLHDIWGSSHNDVFAVGTSGTILHYDGNTWTSMSSNTTENLYGVWGSSGTNVYAVGDNGTIVHYNGTVWDTVVDTGTTEDLFSIWASSPSDAFAVGDNGTILHYDGNTWASMDSGTTELFESVWGASGTDVFTVGDNGTILHYDGSAWSAMNSGTTKWLNAVWGSSGTDVFAVGFSSIILHYDGNTWTESGLGTTERLEDVWGTSGMEVFVVGDLGGIFHYNGTTWSVMRPGGSNGNAVTDLEFHLQSTDIVYASTFGAGVYISPNQAGNWLNLGTPKHKVFAISTSSLYAATQSGLLQCTGTGVIAGQVTDALSGAGIDGAIVFNDMGVKTISVNGEYMMVSPCGICCVTAIADGHANTTAGNEKVLGGDVTWVNIAMESGITDPSVGPGPSTISTSGGGSYCFIATAAYGSPLAEQLEILRTFRDDYLLPHPVGQKLVDVYYSKGKSIAMCIESHPWLKGLARVILNPVVGLSWLLLLTSAFAKGVIGVCILMGYGTVVRSFEFRCKRTQS